MVKESTSSSGQLDAADAAHYQLRTNLFLKSADLSTERRLRLVQPFLGGECQASFFGDSNEVAKVPQFHSIRPYL